MTRPQTKSKSPTPTARGVATRTRIIAAASQLVAERGVSGTRLEDVMEASGTSKSQIYHYFADRDALMEAVVAKQSDGVLEFQRSCFSRVRSLEDLRTWRDAIVEICSAKRGVGGCPIGSLASELADRSESARAALALSFAHWESHIAAALLTMQHEAKLSQAADVPELATAIVAALQGGLLMAQTTRTTRPLEIALDMALDRVSQHALPGGGRD